MPSARRLLPGTLAGAVMLVALASPALADDWSSFASGGDQPRVSLSSVLGSPASDLPSGPRANGTAILPDGRFVTPVGKSVKVSLEPMNEVLSHDGRRLYVSSEGQDDKPLTPEHERYFSIINTKTMHITKVRDDALQSGIAESPNGRRIYVDQGQWDSVGVFRRTPGKHGGVGTISKLGNWRLHPKKPDDFPWGMALSPNGKRLYVTGFSGDSFFTINTKTGKVLSRVATGSYPYGIVLSNDGKRAYVSNWGEYNADAALGISSPIAPPPVTYAGYNSANSDSVWTYDLTDKTPKVIATTRIGESLNGADVDGGSSPSGMSLSPDGRTLAVMSSNDDEVDLLDLTHTTHTLSGLPSIAAPLAPSYPITEIDMRVLVGTASIPSPTGAQPDAAAWSPDGKVLFVAEGERNDIAVINPAKVAPEGALTTVTAALGDGVGTAAGPNRAAIVGRIPTAWYPSSLAVSKDGRHLYITSMKGLGAGPSTTTGTSYIPNDIHGEVTDLTLSAACPSLPTLSQVSDRDNGLVPHGTEPVGSEGNGYVVPTAFGKPPSSKIKHVFLIIKENRSFDNVFGDDTRAESDGRLTMYGKYVTPNTHAIANEYALSDNYDVTAETSTQGHYSIDTGQDDEFVEKVTPTNYSGKFPYGAWDTVPENIPEGGFIWNNAARHGVHSTVFGEATVVVGLSPTVVGRVGSTQPVGQLIPGLQSDGYTLWDPLYPTQVDIAGTAAGAVGAPAQALAEKVFPFNDEGRASAFDADLAAAENNPTLDKVGSVLSTASISQLNVMLLFDDHTSGYIAGAQTPERQVAENDHGFGRVIQTITHSPYWKNSAIFETEDDTQGGQDHVDAYRSYGIVISPWAKRHYVSHVHTSFQSMIKTIDLILGLPPTSLQELTATSMQDMFINHGAPNLGSYTVRPNNTVPDTNKSIADAPNATLKAAARLATKLPHGIDMGGDILPTDLELARAGELQAHDPNVKPAPHTSAHFLPHGAPHPVSQGKPSHVGRTPPADVCLNAGAAATPPRANHRGDIVLAAAAGLAAGWWTIRRRRRRRSPAIAPTIWDTSLAGA